MTAPWAPRVLLGVTGCVGAFKAVLLLRLMRKAGWEVRTILTEAGAEFVRRRASTLSAATRWHATPGTCRRRRARSFHVDLSDWADAMVIYPATANTLGGLAAGLADDLLRLTALCFGGPILVCPAMHTHARQPCPPARRSRNSRRRALTSCPASKGLASGDIGRGRLPEPEVAMAQLARLMGPKDLVGRRILVSAGPTREHIDPVRFLSIPPRDEWSATLSPQRRSVEAPRSSLSAAQPVSCRPREFGLYR